MLFSFVEASEGEQKANDLHAYYNKIEPPGNFILCHKGGVIFISEVIDISPIRLLHVYGSQLLAYFLQL